MVEKISWDTTNKYSHRDTQHLKTKRHRDKCRERERERERERDFAQSFPVTAGPPGPKYTATDTCTEGSFGRSPLCKGTCANKFGPVNTGPAKERALAWRSLSRKSPVKKSLLTGARSTSRISRAQWPPLSQHGGLPVVNGQRGTLITCASVVSLSA